MRYVFFLLITFNISTWVFSQESTSVKNDQPFFTLTPTKTLIEMAQQQNGVVEITDKGDTTIATKTWKVVRRNTNENREITKTLIETNDTNKNVNYAIHKKANSLSTIPTKTLIEMAQQQNGVVEITDKGDTIIATKTWKVVRGKFTLNKKIQDE
jgi:bifunctional ADP-heptose synthase (sugar kinase/adenylyltransferase)